MYRHHETYDWHPDEQWSDSQILEKSSTSLMEKETTTTQHYKELSRDILTRKFLLMQKAPTPWRIEHQWHRLAGVMIGWWLVYALLYRHGVFCCAFNIENLDAGDLLLFSLAWIGINGRLPSLAHGLKFWKG